MRLSLTPSIQEFDALSEFARVERRMPLDAARFLIAEGLARRGLIPQPVIPASDTPVPVPIVAQQSEGVPSGRAA